MKIAKSKYKLDRRTGANILSKSKSPVHTRNYRPGQHGQSKSSSSEYGKRLMEVAKLRQFYGGLRFSYLKAVFKEAANKKNKSSSNRMDDKLINILESRLSTLVYKAKFANSPFAARQLVSHKHILVNGNIVNIPSYRVKVGDVVELRDSMAQNINIVTTINNNERIVPNHIKVESPRKFSVVTECSTANVTFSFPLNLQSIVEFMSKYI